jgi:hypothetical protein
MNGGHLGLHTVLIATEVNDPIEALVTATAMAAGDHATIVSAFVAVL